MDLPINLELFFDGSVEPRNPGGTATYGWAISTVDGVELRHSFGVICSGPEATNNLAEYCALGRGLRYLASQRWQGHLQIYGDSMLVVRQVAGEWRCKNIRLQKLRDRVYYYLEQIGTYDISWVPREQNARADELSRMAYVQATGEQPPERTAKTRRSRLLPPKPEE